MRDDSVRTAARLSSATCSCRRRGDAGALHQTGNDRSMRLAAKLGFVALERFEESDAEQCFGVWSAELGAL